LGRNAEKVTLLRLLAANTNKTIGILTISGCHFGPRGDPAAQNRFFHKKVEKLRPSQLFAQESLKKEKNVPFAERGLQSS
jgi:S-adenosylmethionine:diacylglycerol 3-amino-3-carboxypropyl transferase